MQTFEHIREEMVKAFGDMDLADVQINCIGMWSFDDDSRVFELCVEESEAFNALDIYLENCSFIKSQTGGAILFRGYDRDGDLRKFIVSLRLRKYHIADTLFVEQRFQLIDTLGLDQRLALFEQCRELMPMANLLDYSPSELKALDVESRKQHDSLLLSMY